MSEREKYQKREEGGPRAADLGGCSTEDTGCIPDDVKRWGALNFWADAYAIPASRLVKATEFVRFIIGISHQWANEADRDRGVEAYRQLDLAVLRMGWPHAVGKPFMAWLEIVGLLGAREHLQQYAFRAMGGR